MRTVVLRVVALALLLLLALFSVLSIRTMRRLPDTVVYFVQATDTAFTLAPAGRVSRTDSEEDRLRAALNVLIAGPSSAEQARGLFTSIPAETEILGLSLEQAVLSVDLSPAFETSNSSPANEQGRLYQLYYTLTQSKSVDKVYLQLAGSPVRVFGSEGLTIARPWQRSTDILPVW